MELTSFYRSKREEIHRLHVAGRSGRLIVEALSDLTDAVILRAVECLAFFPNERGALVAIGGYGRRERSPLSDVDLMILSPSPNQMKDAPISDLLCVLWDLGLKVGHAVRTIDDCITLARGDRIIATSMTEARFLVGDRDLFDRFYKTFFNRIVNRDFAQSLLQQEPRSPSPFPFQRTPYLAEPNVKTSPGGLRDMHYMKWVARACDRTNNGAELHLARRLTAMDYKILTDAQDFLWRVRNELHFQKSDDHLTVERQEEMAIFMGFENRVDFMRHYYTHAEAIFEAASLVREAGPQGVWQHTLQRFTRKYIPPGFYLYRQEMVPAVSPSDCFFEDPTNRILLFLLAKEHQKTIPPSVMEVLRSLKPIVVEPPALSKAALTLFRRLLSTPGGIADTLRKMRQAGLLEQILPEFAPLRGLIQQSRSHFFTTDEHTFQAIEAAENLIGESSPFGTLYAEIRRKDILHLALLLHDVGKGADGDHSQTGAVIANAVASRLGLTEEERSLLMLLVDHHLLFSEVAFYRDFTNEPILITFARAIGRPETLNLLLMLTVADIRAVSPTAWSSWKGELLLKLYHEAKIALSGEEPQAGQDEAIRQNLKEATRGKYPEIWQIPVLQALTPRYLLITPFEKIKTDLEHLYRLFTQPMDVIARYNADTETTEYTFYTTDTPGLFLTMTGVLAAKGLSIISAQVFTHANGMVVNTFSIMDPYVQGPLPPEMTDTILSDIKRIRAGSTTIEELFRKGRRYPRGAIRTNGEISVQVAVDNESSEASTIIDIFAPDFPGLLYGIAKTILSLGLSVHSARIATRLDQIVDVFYVQSPEQKKITDAETLGVIASHLKNDIEAARSTYKAASSSPLSDSPDPL